MVMLRYEEKERYSVKYPVPGSKIVMNAERENRVGAGERRSSSFFAGSLFYC